MTLTSDDQTTGISLAIPFYNEGEILSSTLKEVGEFLSSWKCPFELLLGDDGSTDQSSKIAKDFVGNHPDYCRLLQNPQNRGRGSILTQAFREAKFPIIAYVDADLEIGLTYVDELRRKFQEPEVQVCIGSKLVGNQPQVRAFYRDVASHVFNFLIHRLLHSKVTDHQCGLKGFRREVVELILPEAKEEGWAWDTEMLLLAQKRGYPIHEFPVHLVRRRKSTVSFVSTTYMFLQKMFVFRQRGLAL